jgi:dihydroxy-acid dehydratase
VINRNLQQNLQFSIPGALMPLARKNSIGLTMYGGAMRTGRFQNKPINVGTNYEAVGAHSVGKLTREDLKTIERCSCPGLGACPGNSLFYSNS